MVCRLKDCRRLATRYDRLSAVFLGSVHLTAAPHLGGYESQP
jgi:transposase